MGFWQGFILFSLLAMFFVLWPTLVGFVRERKSPHQHSGAQDGARPEELEKTRVMTESDTDKVESSAQNLAQTHRQDEAVTLSSGEKSVLGGFRSRLPIIAIAVLMPFMAIFMYWQLGAKDDWKIHQLSTSYSNATTTEEAKEAASALVRALQARLISSPENVGNWYLLASMSAATGSYDESVRAYRQLRELESGSPFVIAELAQALFLRAGNIITPEIRDLTQLSLSLNPNMTTALGLGGIDAYQTGNYQQAITYWQRAVKLLDPSSSASKALSQGIARAKIALGTSSSGKTDTKKEQAAAAIDVKVEIDSAKLSLKGDETVFVYARAWQGAKVPLAIKRFSLKELPDKVVLDSSSAMAQGMDITSVSQLEIVARISSSGLATPQSGDWIATAGPVFLNSQKGPVSLKVTEQIP